MAQDFRAAFGLGPDDVHIADLDVGGVALAAIQGLYAQVQEENARLKAELEQKSKAIDSMQKQLDAITARLNTPAR
jgi:Skp family chaperone for outer membrane proteins